MFELIGNILMLCGALFTLIAALGLYRLPGLYLKMHAATKAGTLGAGLLLLGVTLHIGRWHTLTEVILLIWFVAITNPISAYLIANTASRFQDADER